VRRFNSCGPLQPIEEGYAYEVPVTAAPKIIGAKAACSGTTNRYISYHFEEYESTWSLAKGGGQITQVHNDTVDVVFDGRTSMDTLVLRGKNSCGVGPIIGRFPVQVVSAAAKPEILYRILWGCRDYSNCPGVTPYVLVSSIVNAKSYQWYRNRVKIQGATDSTYRFVFKSNDIREFMGEYQVEVETECGKAISDIENIYYLFEGLEDDALSSRAWIQLSPNPATDMILVKSSGGAIKRYVVYDQTGNIILDGTVSATELELQVSSLSKGMYMLEVETETRRTRQKLIVAR
jgi:hypothetical protein